MKCVLPSLVFLLCCPLAAFATPSQTNAVDILLADDSIEIATGTSFIANIMDSVKGTLLTNYQRKVPGEGFRLYIKFQSPLPEGEIITQLKQNSIPLEPSPKKYDTNAPYFPALCFLHNDQDKEASKKFREFVEETLRSCRRYYVTGHDHLYTTLYVDDSGKGKPFYHLFQGFSYD